MYYGIVRSCLPTHPQGGGSFWGGRYTWEPFLFLFLAMGGLNCTTQRD